MSLLLNTDHKYVKSRKWFDIQEQLMLTSCLCLSVSTSLRLPVHFYESLLGSKVTREKYYFSRTNENISRRNEKFSSNKEKISRTNEENSQRNKKLSRTNEKISRTDEKNSRTNEKISRRNENNSRSNEKLSRTNEKLSRRNENMSRTNAYLLDLIFIRQFKKTVVLCHAPQRPSARPTVCKLFLFPDHSSYSFHPTMWIVSLACGTAHFVLGLQSVWLCRSYCP